MSLWDRIKRAARGSAPDGDPVSLLDGAIKDLEDAQEEALAALQSADARDRQLLEDGLRQLAGKLREARAKRESLVGSRDRLDRVKAVAAEMRRLDAEVATLTDAERAGERGRRIRARLVELRAELAEIREPGR